MFVSREQETTSYEFLRIQYTCANLNENSIIVKYKGRRTYNMYMYKCYLQVTIRISRLEVLTL